MSLKLQAAAGVKWTATAFAVQMVARIVLLGVLARILEPADFGLVATLSAVIAIMQAFGDFGLNGAIVQRRDLDRGQLSSVFWLSWGLGIIICGALWLASPLVVAAFDQPRLGALTGFLSLRFLLSPPGVPFLAVLQRDLQFRRLAVMQITSTLTGAAVTLVAARQGAGVFALVWGELASVLTQSALAVVVGSRSWRPSLRFRRDDLRGHVRFGAHQVGERAFSQFAMNVDYLLVGMVLGSTSLGLYSIAFELASTPTRLINPVFTRVAFPVFARVQDDDRALGRGYIELSRMLVLIQFPLLVGIGVLAPRIVHVFLGADWARAAPLIQSLSVLGALRVLCNPAGSAFLAKGRSDIGFYWAVFAAIVNLAVFSIIVHRGVEAVTWAWVILITVYWILLTAILNKLIALRISAYVRALARPVLISTLLGVALFIADRAVSALGWTDVSTLLALLGVGAVLSIVLTWCFDRGFVVAQLRLIRGEVAT